MVEEKGEINTSVASLNKLPYFCWITAIVVSAKAFGQHICFCWTHACLSTSGCGFIMCALRLNQCCNLFIFFLASCFYLDRLVWPPVLGPLQPGRPHPPLFPWASAPPHCSQTWRSSSAERENGKSKREECEECELTSTFVNQQKSSLWNWGRITLRYHMISWNSSTFAGISVFVSACVGGTPAPPQWEAPVPVAAWAHLAE